ncbi:hypothetical protein [Nonomuraea cavernae]|uniref:Mce-associated membrane protein n=1 Tax=Nonomuraea cavernae TaxID=2045107 RepID=A0A918DSV5_9ACTN|nr:hypothetical protein [Nonomuraea cavernae]MCA2190343.1 hypothetical protein [Nonomuraea cavernae]GGO80699.1 hypothetical protein GCM10012289_67950 [Nonomuraea cavernae]
MTTQQDLTEGRQPSETEPAPAAEPTTNSAGTGRPAEPAEAGRPAEPAKGERSAATDSPEDETTAAEDGEPRGDGKASGNGEPSGGEATEGGETSGGEATEGGETSGGEATEGGETSGGEATEGGEATGRVRVTRARVMGALAAMLTAALAATAVLQWVSADRAHDALARLESERALRLEVSGAASSFGQSLLSYDYQDLQTTRSTLMAQATGDFLTTYDEAFGGAMAQVIVKLKAVSRATVREVYLSDVDEATAHAIVVVDQQVNTAEAIRSVTGSHLKVTLVKEKGVWKVQEVTVLGAAKEDQYNLDGTRTDAKKKD